MSKPTAITEAIWHAIYASRYSAADEISLKIIQEQALTQIEQLVREKVIPGADSQHSHIGSVAQLHRDQLRTEQNQALTNLIRGEK